MHLGMKETACIIILFTLYCPKNVDNLILNRCKYAIEIIKTLNGQKE